MNVHRAKTAPSQIDRNQYGDADFRPAQIYAEATALAQQQTLQAMAAAMRNFRWKPLRRGN
jgi:hypothetical protein